MIPKFQIRAKFDEQNITVYQAYNASIADSAVEQQTFLSPPFKMERMTWIKPSFLWMMYRSGWAKKDMGQERVLAIEIKLSGLDWAFKNATLSHRPEGMSLEEWREYKLSHPVRIQWDPERDIQLNALDHRSIQIGLTGEAVNKYVNDWIVSIKDITPEVHRIHALVIEGRIEQAQSLLPEEKIFDNLQAPKPNSE